MSEGKKLEKLKISDATRNWAVHRSYADPGLIEIVRKHDDLIDYLAGKSDKSAGVTAGQKAAQIFETFKVHEFVECDGWQVDFTRSYELGLRAIELVQNSIIDSNGRSFWSAVRGAYMEQYGEKKY